MKELFANEIDDEKLYKKIKVKVGDKFIIAPQPLLRNDPEYFRKNLNTEFQSKVNEYYKSNPQGAAMIFACLTEVLANFWLHATEDDTSILVADGNQAKIEIACADNGEGIISTLKSNSEYDFLKKPEDFLKRCVEKGVTSKPNTNHMGYGLWMLDQITRQAKGKFHLYSQGGYYCNDYGKITVGRCGYWQGTILYMNLPLSNPVNIAEILNESSSKKDIQINFS